MLILTKLLIAITLVIGLSLLAENVSPKVAGILVGYPTSTAISLFFFGLEVSPEFAAESAIYNILGLSASLVFVYAYYIASKHIKKNALFFSALSATLGYIVSAWALHFVHTNKFISILIPIVTALFFIYIFRNIQDCKIENKKDFSYKTLFIRAIMAGSILLLITFLPRFMGAEWSGLFSAFPASTLPLLLAIHFSYTEKEVHTIIKNVPTGIFSLIFFSLTISIVYPLWGIYIGTIIAFVIATIYLVIYRKFISRFRKRIKNLKLIS